MVVKLYLCTSGRSGFTEEDLWKKKKKKKKKLIKKKKKKSSIIDYFSSLLKVEAKPEETSPAIVPFEDLLPPNERAPQLPPSALASEGQKELLEIIYQARDGELSLQEAESLVAGWKKQYQTPRWDKKSFKEKKVNQTFT